jgi:hypothetical protein
MLAISGYVKALKLRFGRYLRVIQWDELKCVMIAKISTIVLFLIPESKEQAFRT